MASKRTIADTAAAVMREQGKKLLWLGDPNLWHEVYLRHYGHNGSHPMNVYHAVISAVRRSKLFRHAGYIKSCGWSDRETRHPTFELVDTDRKTI